MAIYYLGNTLYSLSQVVSIVTFQGYIHPCTYSFFAKLSSALAGVAHWIECWPANQRVPSSIHSQGTCLGCGPGTQLGVHERQPQIDVSLPLSISIK